MDIVNELTQYNIQWWGEDAQATVYHPPAGHVEVQPCSVVITPGEVHVAWKPNEIDLAHLAKGGTIWLTQLGGLAPHRLTVQPPA